MCVCVCVELHVLYISLSNIQTYIHIHSQASELNDLVSKAFKANFAKLSLKRDKKKGKKSPWSVHSNQQPQQSHDYLSPQQPQNTKVRGENEHQFVSLTCSSFFSFIFTVFVCTVHSKIARVRL